MFADWVARSLPYLPGPQSPGLSPLQGHVVRRGRQIAADEGKCLVPKWMLSTGCCLLGPVLMETAPQHGFKKSPKLEVDGVSGAQPSCYSDGARCFLKLVTDVAVKGLV